MSLKLGEPVSSRTQSLSEEPKTDEADRSSDGKEGLGFRVAALQSEPSLLIFFRTPPPPTLENLFNLEPASS